MDHMQAVRAFNRVFTPIARELEIACEADAGFDAGEFSRTFHLDRFQAEYFRIMGKVAARFGLTCDQLHSAIQADQWRNCLMFQESHQVDKDGKYIGGKEQWQWAD